MDIDSGKIFMKVTFSLDDDTMRKIRELAHNDKSYNKSAVVRRAVDLLYRKEVKGEDV